MLAAWQDDILTHLALLPADAEQNITAILQDLHIADHTKRHDQAAKELVKNTLFPNKKWSGQFTRQNTPTLGFFGTDFQYRVMMAMLTVPAGKTVSYGELAEISGKNNAARAVGSVCARNPIPFIIPCHRILAANGGLGGYAFGTALKRELLRLEHVSL